MLTKKQRRYVSERVRGRTQREAYRAAYGCKGWKPESIDQSACKLEKRGEVKARLDKLLTKASTKAEQTFTQEESEAVDIRTRIIEELIAIAFGNEDETTDYCKIDKSGNEIVTRRVKYPHGRTAEKLVALSKLADIYKVTGGEEEKQIRIIVPEELKDFLV